jgi:uncharacterized membrane protein
MLIEDGLLSGGVAVVASALGGVGLAFAIHGAPWKAWLLDREHRWVWFTSMALLVVVWSMKAGITPGLSVQFLLVSALTLMHGWHLAVVAAALVLAVLTQVGGAEWSSFGPNLLCAALIPALFTARLHEFVHDHLPRNYFVYFFVTAFFGAALAFNAAGLSRAVLVGLSGTLETARLGAEYFAILPLMSLGEAVANGMLVGMAVIYRGGWVMSFDDRLYLSRQ